MSYRRVLIVLFVLAVAALACTLGPTSPTSPTSKPPTNAPPTSAAPSKTPPNFHNGGVTPEAPTEGAPTEAAATEAPPTKAPTKAPTKPPKPTATEQQSSCAALAANGDAFFLANSSDANPSKIDSYPADATEIVPAFDYECNPTAAQLVVVYSFNGQQVYSGKHTLDPSDTAQTFWTSLSKNDGTAMDPGNWGVQFFNNKQLLATGKVVVGGGPGPGPGSSVTVQGTITNKAGGKAIAGAIFMVLNPGVTIQQFVNDNTPDSEIFTYAQTDSSGDFTLPDGLERNQKYSVLVGAKGFKTLSTDSFLIKDSDPDPLVLDVQLSK